MPAGLESTSALRWLALILCAAALLLCWPLWPALVLAAWTASIFRPLTTRLAARLHGRRRAAAVLVTLLALVIAAPVVVAVVGIIGGARDLVETLSEAGTAQGVLERIAVGGDGAPAVRLPRTLGDVVGLAQSYGSEAFGLLTQLAGAAAEALLLLVVYFAAVFAFMREGEKEWEWVVQHSPLRRDQLRRLAAAFDETGRGLLIGVGLTCAVQGLIAMLIYLALGVPQAWVLGPLTGLASIVPVIGVAAIWGPIAGGLLLSGHPIKAAILAVLGLGIIGTFDNLLRPLFSRMGALQLPVLVLFVSAFGGLLVLGAWGAILGPLVVRLSLEAVRMLRSDDGEPE
ncbi:MAG TPA: AI-2E family transporter [Nannocystaceae bacterium]|nr:AI-2E family transporter [Nannocystaceae bacterium]